MEESMPVTEANIESEFLKRGEEIVRDYRIVLERAENGFVGRSVEMPTVFGWGRTADKCVADVTKNASLHAAMLLRKGRIPPRVGDQPLNDVVKFRLTGDEKLILEREAGRRGLGVSEYLRQIALAKHRA
jgi:hypothetical protein